MGTVILIFLLLIILAISISWTISRGAPWVPTSMKMVHKMLKLAELKPDELVYDLGCGDGRFIITAALSYRARAVGIELDPLRFLWCQIMITVLGLRERVKVLHGDLFKADLSEADVVTCFLLPSTNKKIEGKLLDELRPGTRVVSNTFLFNQVPPTKRDGKAVLYHFSRDNTIRESIKKQLLKSKQN
jgi:predicted RNA methylase